MVRDIIKNYPKQVEVLLQKQIKCGESVNLHDMRIILSFPSKDWDSWKTKVEKSKEIAGKYPYAFDEYIVENKISLKKPAVKIARMGLIDKLSFDDVKRLVSESESSWILSQKIISEASFIKRENDLGIEAYTSTRKTKISDSDIVRDKIMIEQYQKRIIRNNEFVEWEKEQGTFSSNFWGLIKQMRPNDGRFFYDIGYNRPAKYGGYETGSFRIWQGFVKEYSPHLLNQQDARFVENYNGIRLFRRKERSFVNEVYDGIYNILGALTSIQEEKPLVVVVNNSTHGWGQGVYDYHYAYIKSLLAGGEFSCCKLSELSCFLKPRKNVSFKYKTIFIIDLITSYEDLENNCKLMLGLFENSIPCIAYYSMIKEYTPEETKKHMIKVSQESIKAFISRVEKNSFYSYMVVPNIMVGTAVHSDEVKETWIDDPSKYLFRIADVGSRHIGGEYSADGGATFSELYIVGDSRSIDDVSKYMYLLFSKMGLLGQFIKNRERALTYINQKRLIKYH